MQEIQYDSSGRMKYHPEFHFNHGKEMTTKELAYLCQNYGRGKRKELAMALGRTEATIAHKVCCLRKNGEFERYKEMDI